MVNLGLLTLLLWSTLSSTSKKDWHLKSSLLPLHIPKPGHFTGIFFSGDCAQGKFNGWSASGHCICQGDFDVGLDTVPESLAWNINLHQAFIMHQVHCQGQYGWKAFINFINQPLNHPIINSFTLKCLARIWEVLGSIPCTGFNFFEDYLFFWGFPGISWGK